MPTPISYKDALRAMRIDRRVADKSYPKGARHYMRAAEREKLGALVISYLSQIAEAREHPTAGLEFVLDTAVGPLVIHYAIAHGTIFSIFDNPKLAASRLFDVNPHSGKWNFHHGREHRAEVAFENWRRNLEMILPH